MTVGDAEDARVVIIIIMTVGDAEDARIDDDDRDDDDDERRLFMFFIYDSKVPLDPIGDAEGA